MNYDFNKTSTFDYNLPIEQIAQDPVVPRDLARLMLLDRKSGRTEHKIFKDIIDYLMQGDLLIMNDTRVLPVRVRAVKKYGGAKAEIFFLSPVPNEPRKWTALVNPGKKLKPGTIAVIGGDTEVTVGEVLDDGLRYIYFAGKDEPLDIIHKYGKTPLPPYITNSHADSEEYQTVYSDLNKENSAAAPTAGLHFTNELLDKIYGKGVDHAFVTLQVGLGTFRPVKSENISEHIMHTELCEITDETAKKIISAKRDGRRVIAVGTTVVRTLESFAANFGEIKHGRLNSNLFIRPGFEFKVIDGLITNFHLPKSTLLMLVAAFAGFENIMNAYQEAVKEKYRFFSFGDAMFIS